MAISRSSKKKSRKKEGRNSQARPSLDAVEGGTGQVHGHQQVFQVGAHQHIVSRLDRHICR